MINKTIQNLRFTSSLRIWSTGFFLIAFFVSIGLTGLPGWNTIITAMILLLFLAFKSGLFMMLCAVWAWRYPGSVEEWQRRVSNGLKVGWFK